MRPRYVELLRTRRRSSRPPPTTSATSTTASTPRSTCAPGRSKHSCAPICAKVRQRLVLEARSGLAPARALGRGPEADRRRAAARGHRRDARARRRRRPCPRVAGGGLMLPLKDNIPTKTTPYITIGDPRQLHRLVLGAERPGVDVHVIRTLLSVRHPGPCHFRSAITICRGTRASSRDVHACELGAHPRQHAVLLDLRQRRRGRARPRGFSSGTWSPASGDGRSELRTLDFAGVRAASVPTSARAARSQATSARTSCSSSARVLTDHLLLHPRDPPAGSLGIWIALQLWSGRPHVHAAAVWRRHGVLRPYRRLCVRRCDGSRALARGRSPARPRSVRVVTY